MRTFFFSSHHIFASAFFLLTFFASCANKGEATENSVVMKDTVLSEGMAVKSITQIAEINGRKIAYRSIGSGKPMILCQRFRGNLDDWDPAFLDALARDYRVITFNYSGFASSTGLRHTDMKGFASDVVDLASALNLERFIIGGWSFGGWVAQFVTTERPELVSQTILIGTRPPGKVSHQMEQIFLTTAFKPVNDLEDEIILFFEPISERSRELGQQSHARISARTTGRDSLVTMDDLPFYVKAGDDYENDPYKIREKLMSTKTPILVISGDHEVCFPPENWFELNRRLPTTQLVVIPRAGHGPQHQYPEMIASFIKSFIQNNELTGTSS